MYTFSSAVFQNINYEYVYHCSGDLVKILS